MIDSYFDKVYCLNQASRPDRWQQFQSEAARVGITKAEQVYTIPHENSFISFCNSQLALLQQFYDSGGVNLLAFEDDVIFKSYSHLPQVFDEVKYDWDIMYLGANVFKHEPHTQHTRRVHAAWTTHAVAYSRDVVRVILNEYSGWEHDNMYDAWLSEKLLSKVKALVVVPMICWQRDVVSDLWQRHVSYGWDEMEKRLI